MIDRPKEWWTQVDAKGSTSLENRKCSFCGGEMICVNTQDGEFTCTTCAEYANHDVLDFIEKLKTENERLKRALWLARAMNGFNTTYNETSYHNYMIEHPDTKISIRRWFGCWNLVERKCLEYAERFK